MRILLAEYAVATGLLGTCWVEGMAMLSTLAASFQRCGHEVVYPTAGPVIGAGEPVLLRSGFGDFLAQADADAGLVIAPDDLIPGFVEVMEENASNLGSSPKSAGLCADKASCTIVLEKRGVPVVEVVTRTDGGPGPYVLKPRYGCASEGVEIVSNVPENDDRMVTRYHEGEHLSVSLVSSEDRVLPLTLNRQLVDMDGSVEYRGSQVPYPSAREEEIFSVARMAARALDLRGYAGIDLVVGDLPRVVDVNPRPTTSIVGIARVMQEELADLILRARFGTLPERVTIEGECTFTKEELEGIRSAHLQ